MTYKETVSWMFQQLPMYQNQGKVAYKEDLSNTLILDRHLNSPHRNFKSIHVAGTNGKGSTSHMLASVLQEAGYNVGLYTSPHLKDFRERIRINGIPISKHSVIGFIERNKSFLEENNLSFFEMTVGMAFEYFSKKDVDIAVIEVGLGGRLDSTNIINPVLSVITNIGMDHMQFLGDTKEKIASEKAGIIKQSIPVVIGETQRETQSVFNNVASINLSTIYFADKLTDDPYDSDLKGLYQKNNVRTVMQTVKVLNKVGIGISDYQLKKGLLNVSSNTGIRGRWQVLGACPKIICDTAHNLEGLNYVVEQLKLENYKSLHIVFGVVSDKDVVKLLGILPKKALYYLCRPNIPRGMNVLELHSCFVEYGFVSEAFESTKSALDMAVQRAREDDLIFVGGSTFTVADII